MLRLSPEFASLIQQLIDALQPGAAPGDWVLRRCKHEFNALPLLGDSIHLWLLRPDGQIWCFDHEALNGRPEPETDPARCHAALTQGARRFPQLLLLVPPCPPGAG